MLQNATSLRNSAPWPPNIFDEDVACTAPAMQNAPLQIFFKCPMPTMVFDTATKSSCFAHFWPGAESLAPAKQNDDWMSKSGRNVMFFSHVGFETCFAPLPRAFLRHLNFQKWSETEVLWAFWLQNLLRVTAACNFWFLTWPDGSAPAALPSLPSGAPKHSKTQCFASFRPFRRAPGSSFFWLFLFSDLLFSSLLFSDSSHLCFSICPKLSDAYDF